MKLAYRFANTVGLRLLQVIQNATLNENLHHLLVPDARNAYPVEKGIIIGFFDNFSRKCLTTVLANLILPQRAGGGGNIPRKNKKPHKKMKKTLFTLALCAASLIGTAWADFEVKTGQYVPAIITGTGSYGEFIQALKDFNPGYEEGALEYIQLGDKENGESANVTFSEGDQYTPITITLYFALATLEFKDILTLQPDPSMWAGPGMLAGYISGWSGGPLISPGSLTISVDKSAVDGWLAEEKEQQGLEKMASWTLMDNSAKIQPVDGANVVFQLINEEKEVVVPQYGEYTFDDSHKYYNAGIVWAEGDLKKEQIALHFVPGGEGEWGGGQFNVLALGKEYIPTPEPTTGTLSLLALASLAARRRRK